MSTELGLAIRRKSATPASATDIRADTTEIAKIVDIDLCIGCKACEVACKEWNDLAGRGDVTTSAATRATRT